MCGRVRLSSDVSEIKLVFSIPPHRPTPNFPPSWNAAPTDQFPIVRFDPKAGERSLDVLRWGLVPFWAKDIKVGIANNNATAEGIENRPANREAFQRRRWNASRKAGLFSIPSALALMFANPTLRSLAQYGTRTHRIKSKLRSLDRGSKRTTGSGSIGATFQLGGKFGVGARVGSRRRA